MEGIRVGFAARGLRARISAGRCGLSPGLPALGLAATVLHRRIGRAAHFVRARQSERARSLAPVTHGLDHVLARHIPPLEALRLSCAIAGHNEFHSSRHSGYVPDVPAATAWFQSAAHVELHRAFDGWSTLRRIAARIYI